jgi:hypothetical protein
MDAGRELDALVAEKVMGWKPHFRNTAFYVKAEDEGKVMDHHCMLISEWHPSTDIAAAWRVVEHMIDHNPFGHGWWEMAYRPHDTNRGATVNFVGDPRYVEYASTVPLAICLAALKAVGVKA